ncbi:MAG TPA: copper resistance CopC family protein [Steroidobacter sp.]|nr:copper resistance CopC family protein [Steroidobacter sp.]
MTYLKSIGAGLLMAIATSGAALPHANYTASSPSANATLRKPPHEVSVVVTQQVETAFSRIEVLDAKGKRVDKNNTRVTGKRSKLVVDLKPLGPGTYTVRWFAASVDTHRTNGSFKFKVAP